MSSWVILPAALIVFLAGCSTPARVMPREGPGWRAELKIEEGKYDGGPALRVVSEHYLIETTIADREMVQSLGQLMEGALGEYRKLTPGVAVSDRPMKCHVFASRSQWAGYTKENAGTDAEIYLQISRGGYAAGDRYVAYFIGDVGTWSVTAHEGFHQYTARHFKRRPPPFLEEGLACLFEDVEWEHGLPRWDMGTNGTRESGLRKAVKGGRLIPLARLCTMHAGQVVNSPGAQIDGFYAQSWAFARFLWMGQGGKNRVALQTMLRDLAMGTAPGGVEEEQPWDPGSSKPLLEHYLGRDLPEIDGEYQAYMRKLVSVERPADETD